jgi:hypothetical protein
MVAVGPEKTAIFGLGIAHALPFSSLSRG